MGVQMMESMAGVANPKSVTTAQLCRFLKDSGILEVGRFSIDGLNQMMFSQRTRRAIVGLKMSFWWRKFKAMFLTKNRAVRMHRDATQRMLETIEAQLKDRKQLSARTSRLSLQLARRQQGLQISRF